jgi:hypothetical protein
MKKAAANCLNRNLHERPRARARTHTHTHTRGCMQKFPEWVDNENNNNNNNNKHSLRGNTKGYGGKTHYTDSQNSDAIAPSGRELYHLQFSLQAASPEPFGYKFIYARAHTHAYIYIYI